MARLLSPASAETGRIFVMPHFDEKHYPRYQSCLCRNRSDLALIRLVEELMRDGCVPPGRFDLAGYSGGAQFAHRFTWLYPHWIERLVVSSAGWYTFPDNSPFPYGMGPSESSRLRLVHQCLKVNLRAFLDRKIMIRVGEHDDAVDAVTRSGPEIEAQQGRDRKTRARIWHQALLQAARDLGVVPQVDFALMPGCGHSFEECVRLGGLSEVISGMQQAPS